MLFGHMWKELYNGHRVLDYSATSYGLNAWDDWKIMHKSYSFFWKKKNSDIYYLLEQVFGDFPQNMKKDFFFWGLF